MCVCVCVFGFLGAFALTFGAVLQPSSRQGVLALHVCGFCVQYVCQAMEQLAEELMRCLYLRLHLP